MIQGFELKNIRILLTSKYRITIIWVNFDYYLFLGSLLYSSDFVASIVRYFESWSAEKFQLWWKIFDDLEDK